MPTQAHALLQTYLAFLIFQCLAHQPLGRVGTEWRCIFGHEGRERAYVPDVVFAAFGRLSRGDAREHPYLLTAPDLIVEIISPGQSVAGFIDRVVFFLYHGVRLVWVIEPADETIHVFTRDSEPLTLGAGDTLDGGDVLPGFTASVSDIFTQLRS